MLDDITYVKNESVVISDDVDLTISTGDFIIGKWFYNSINTINIDTRIN